MSFLYDFLCLKKSRFHGFARKFIEKHLDIRAIAENQDVKIDYISKSISVVFDNKKNRARWSQIDNYKIPKDGPANYLNERFFFFLSDF